MSTDISVYNYDNGIRLVCEPMDDVASAAIVFAIPCGVSRDPQLKNGLSGVLSELIFRGAGPYDNQALNDQFDMLGIHRNSSANTMFLNISGSMVSDKLPQAIELFSQVIQNPLLPDDQVEFCKSLSIQSIDSIDDDPRQKISILARSQFLNYPYNQSHYGQKADIASLSHQEIYNHYKRFFAPSETIIAVAGNIDPDQVYNLINQFFGNWSAQLLPELSAPQAFSRVYHEENDGNQVHIAVLYPSIHTSHPDFYKALLSVSVLSGGMGSRLFTEVREKRGLCYAVGANHMVIDKLGAVFCYAGSSPANAQQALDVIMHELSMLAQGVTEEELQRARIGLRASLVMQGESNVFPGFGMCR